MAKVSPERRAAIEICDAFGTTYVNVGFLGAKHWDDVEAIIVKHVAPLRAKMEKLADKAWRYDELSK